MFENDDKKLVIPKVDDQRSLEEKMGFHPKHKRRLDTPTPMPSIETERANMKLTHVEKALRMQSRRLALDFSAEMISTLYQEAKTAPLAHDRIDAANKLLHFALGKPATIVSNEDGTAIVPNFNISFSNQVIGDQPKPVIQASVTHDDPA